MAEIIWTEPALNNLDDIAEYIALQNIQAAKSLVQKVFDKVERLSDHPYSGKIPVELEELPFREIVVTPCRVFYKIDGEKVFILFVMREEQSLRKFMLSN